MSFRRKLMSSMNTLTLSEQSKTVNAAGGSFTLYLYYNDILLKSDGVTISNSGNITSSTYSSSTGQISINYSMNELTYTSVTSEINVYYNGNETSFKLIQTADRYIRTDTYYHITTGSATGLSGSLSGNYNETKSVSLSGTLSGSGTSSQYRAYESGRREKISESSISDSGSWSGSISMSGNQISFRGSGSFNTIGSKFTIRSLNKTSTGIDYGGASIHLDNGVYTITPGLYSLYIHAEGYPIDNMGFNVGSWSFSVDSSTGAWSYSQG